MGMTMSEKILAAHAGRDRVEPGELLEVPVDLVLGNDITAPVAIGEFRQAGIQRVFDPERVVLVADHFVPARDIKSAALGKTMREFAREQGLTNYFSDGSGIEHVLLPEQGLVVPGDVVVGADSHTCTYGALGAFATGVGSTDMAYAMATGRTWFRVPESIRFVYHGRPPRWVSGKDYILYTIGRIGVDGAHYAAMEFAGPAIERLGMDERFTIANMAIEAGAKVGLIAPDETTLEYVRARARRPFTAHRSDPDAAYAREWDFDVAGIEPQVALPHLPSNTKPVTEVTGIGIDQVVVGSCTNGRITDLRVCARILKGRRVNPNVRMIVFPGSREVYVQALREGIIEALVEAGAAVSTPTCGPCLGGHMGVLAEGERAISTTNRNFVGRMGHPGSEVYLSSPAVATASAVLGRIAHPDEVAGADGADGAEVA